MDNSGFSQEPVESVAMEAGSFADGQHQLQLEGDNNILIVMQGDNSGTDLQSASRATVSNAQGQVNPHCAMCYWVVQPSWFAWVNALHNLSCKESQKVAAAASGPISEQAWAHAVDNNGSLTLNWEMVQMVTTVVLAIVVFARIILFTGKRWWKMEKKKCLCFLAYQKSRMHVENVFLGHL